MIKIALILPNFLLRDQFGEISDPPIGIASIAGVLERKGYEVLIVDGMAENLEEPEILQRVVDFKPKYIGISCNYCTLHNQTLRLAKRIKETFGSATVVFVGGNHATALDALLLKQSANAIDCIVHGEGEPATLGLVEALEAGEPLAKIPSITFQDNQTIRKNPTLPFIANLDEVGIPAYHLLPMDKYKRYNIVSMRGCPYACSYCASTVIFTRKVRYRSPQNILAEIEYLLSTYGDRLFWFSDDTFTVNRAHTMTLLQAILTRDFQFQWSCLTTVNTVKTDLLEMMKASGCQYISYGIETGSPGLLKYVGKKISPQEILQTSELTHSVGLRHYGFFIVGFPGETWTTIQDTYQLIRASSMDGGAMNILIPLPGTSLWHTLCDEQQLFTPEDMQWDELFARMPDEAHNFFPAQLASRWCQLSPEELLEACRIGQEMFARTRHPIPTEV